MDIFLNSSVSNIFNLCLSSNNIRTSLAFSAEQVIIIGLGAIIPTTIGIETAKSIQNRRRISAGIRNYAEIRSGIPESSSTVSYVALVPVDKGTSVLQLRSATFAPYTLSKCKYTGIRIVEYMLRWIAIISVRAIICLSRGEAKWSPFPARSDERFKITISNARSSRKTGLFGLRVFSALPTLRVDGKSLVVRVAL